MSTRLKTGETGTKEGHWSRLRYENTEESRHARKGTSCSRQS